MAAASPTHALCHLSPNHPGGRMAFLMVHRPARSKYRAIINTLLPGPGARRGHQLFCRLKGCTGCSSPMHHLRTLFFRQPYAEVMHFAQPSLRTVFASLRDPNLSRRVQRLTPHRSEEHTSELQSLMRNSYAVFRLNKKTQSP